MHPPLHRSLTFAFRGLAAFWREERNFRLETLCLIPVLGVGLWLGLQPLEWAAVALAAGMVLGAEAANTIVEDMLDHLHPSHHTTVGRIKDMCAGLVLLSGLAALAVAASVLLPRLG
ncbi:MAG: diacylglycerol kinase [Candidatus Peribacteraceae bacterium]|nr:diacylglycerol kinase [Candidatus Peribacteraceae bacterium]